MPANLTPNYLAAEARFRGARTIEDKLIALDEMYANIPKHKGTEKLRADIKRRISKLREKNRTHSADRLDSFCVEKQGVGRLTLLGPPNSGRSTLFSCLTSAKTNKILLPMAALMECDAASIQIVDTPPILGECAHSEVASLARSSDAIALVLDASDNALLDHIEEIRDVMAKSKTVLAGARDIDLSINALSMPTLVIANKIDLPDVEDNLAVLEEFYAEEFDIICVSALTCDGLDDLKRAISDLVIAHK